MLVGLAIGAAIGAGVAIRHFMWPWERPVVIYRDRPVVVERPVVEERQVVVE